MKKNSAPKSQFETLIHSESEYFSAHKNQATRHTSWSSVPLFQKKIQENLNLSHEARKLLKDKTNISALTIACGDMKGEYAFFKQLNVRSIDAFDISEEKRNEFFANVYDNSIKTEYIIDDANKLKINKKYDLIYMQQSLHHIYDVQHLLKQIADALNKGGIFVLNDYIGPNFLQRSEKQIKYASKIWSLLPERLRTNQKGVVCKEIFIPKKEWLSPCEAINSGAILPGLNCNFKINKSLLLGGILLPIFNGFAQNYTSEDDLFIQLMWEMDRMLIDSALIEPNFIRAILTSKNEY